MPFTFAHPAIILPLTKIRSSAISASCFIAGSITPDFEYFLTMKASGRISHTLTGAFLFDLPVALAIVFLFHSLVKRPFINSLPLYISSRLQELLKFDFVVNFKLNLVGYVSCLLIGIFSHIFWDSFSHPHGYFVDRFSALSSRVSISGLPSLPVYRYVQHISTAVGSLIILYFFHYQSIGLDVQNKFNLKYWLGILGIATLAYLIRWAVGFEYFADIVASLISSLLLGVILVSFIITIRDRR